MDTLGWPSWIASVAFPISMSAMLLRTLLRIAALCVRIARPEAQLGVAYGEARSEEAALATVAVSRSAGMPADEVFSGVVPQVVAHILLIGVLVAFPQAIL